MVKPKYSFKGGNAKNARIRIDYSGKKPKVEFSYPSKKHGFEGSMFPMVCLIWFVIFGMLFLVSQSIEDVYETRETNLNSTPGLLIVNGTIYNVTTYDGCVGYMKNRTAELSEKTCSKITNATYLNNTSLTLSQEIKNELKEELLKAFLLLAAFFIPPCLIYFPFKKNWQNLYPKWQAVGKKKVAVFKTQDIKYSTEDGYYCELPVFKNIVLNYEAKKEFGKYLKFIEIREHKFKFWMEKSKRKMRKITKKQRRKDMLNDWIWYARFYFTKKPITGQLEVLYK